MARAFFDDLDLEQALDGTPAAQPQRVPRVQHVEEDPEVDEEVLDQQLEHDVQLRLETATAYKTLLTGTLFDQRTPATRTVEQRVRNFIRGEIETLLGMASSSKPVAPVAAQFTEVEARILRALIERVARPPQPVQSAEPTVTPRSAPTQPQVVARVVAAPVVTRVQKPVLVESEGEPTEVEEVVPPAPRRPVAKPNANAFLGKQTKPLAGKRVVLSDKETKNPGERITTIKEANGRHTRIYRKDGKVVATRDVTPQKPVAATRPTVRSQEAESLQMSQATIDAQSQSPLASHLLGSALKN